MVVVISVDAYPFLAFSDLTCHLEDMGIGLFWLHCAKVWTVHNGRSFKKLLQEAKKCAHNSSDSSKLNDYISSTKNFVAQLLIFICYILFKFIYYCQIHGI